MRIISGSYGGRPLKAVPGKKTRPTTDKVKESIFNLIGPYFNGGRVLDLYAGSGSLGIEAVSRGMDEAVLVDAQYKAIQTIQENIKQTREPEKFQVYKKKAAHIFTELSNDNAKGSFDLVFLDPPYAKQTIYSDLASLVDHALLKEGAKIVCETDQHTQLPQESTDWTIWKERVYGKTKITIYEVGERK